MTAIRIVFEDYCRERWGFTDRRARQLMTAASVVRGAEETGTIVPVLERQARALAEVEPERRAEVIAEFRKIGLSTEGKWVRNKSLSRRPGSDVGNLSAALP